MRLSQEGWLQGKTISVWPTGSERQLQTLSDQWLCPRILPGVGGQWLFADPLFSDRNAGKSGVVRAGSKGDYLRDFIEVPGAAEGNDTLR